MINLKQLATIIQKASFIFILILITSQISAQGINDIGVVWEKTYGQGWIANIKPNKAKDGYVACGNGTTQQGLVIEFDEDGKQKRRAVIDVKEVYSTKRATTRALFKVAFKTDDGGILAFGDIYDEKAPQGEKAPNWSGKASLADSPWLHHGVWIVKFDKDLKVVRKEKIRGVKVSDGWQTSDGNFVIAGFDQEFNPKNPPVTSNWNGITLLRKYNQAGALVKDARIQGNNSYDKAYREITSIYQYPGTNNFVASTPDHILKINGNAGTVSITSGVKITGTLLTGVVNPYLYSVSPSKDNGAFILTNLNSSPNAQTNFNNGLGFYRLASNNQRVYNQNSKPGKQKFFSPLLLPGNNNPAKYVGTLEERTAYNSAVSTYLYELTDNGKFTYKKGSAMPSGTSLNAVSMSDGFFTAGSSGGNAKIAKLSTCVNFKISNPPAGNKYTEPYAKSFKINKPINYIGSKASAKQDVRYSLVARVVRGTVNGKTAGAVLETLSNLEVATHTISGDKASGKAFDLNRTYDVTSDQVEIGYTITLHDNYTVSNIKQMCDQSYYFTLEGSLTGGTTSGKTNVCYNTSAGALTVANGGGGSGTTTYQWQSQIGSAAWANISGATAATYTTGNLTTTTHFRRMIKNNGGTLYSSPHTVSVYAQVITAATQVNVTCNGSSNGSITATGGAKYRIQKAGAWQAWVASGAFTGLPAGTYKVQAQNAQACLGNELTINITQPTALNFTLTSTNVTTPNGTDGKLTLTLTGGTAPYQYSTNNTTFVAMTSPLTLSNYKKGTYTIYVKDKNGCTTSKQVVVKENLVGGTTTGNVNLCYNTSAGALSVTGGGGGEGATTYQWQSRAHASATWANIAGATAASYTTPNLTAATRYRRAIINTTGTQYSSELTVNVYAQVITAATQVNVTCNGSSNGSITATGGAKYRIQKAGAWQAWVASGAFTGLPAGTYKVQAQNAQACLGNELTINITQPTALNFTLTSTNVTTPNGTDGKLTLTLTGGTAPYQYSTNNTTFVAMTSPLTLSNYKKGTYTIYVKDKNGCTTSKQVVVKENLVGGTTTGSTNICYNTSAGALSVTGSGGGEGATTYQWQSRANASATWANIAGATAASYTTPNLTVATRYRRAIINTTGTQYSSELIVNVYAQVITAATQVNVTCNGSSNGSITATGGAKYRIQKAGAWQAWVTSGAFTGLPAGTYKVQAQNAQACLGNELTVNITQPAALNFTTNVKNISCRQTNNGSVDISVSGGTSPYQYSKDGTNYTAFSNTTTTIGGYSAGNHNVYIKDAKGCISSKQISITRTSLPIGDIVATPTFSIDNAGALKIETSVKNIGAVSFTKALTITIYKNTLGNSTKHIFTSAQAITVAQTIDLEIVIPNFKTDSKWNGCSSIVINFNDKGDGTRDQAVCDESKIREYKLQL